MWVPTYDQTPENGTDAPLLIEREPTACEPTAGSVVAALVVHWGEASVLPALTVREPVFAVGVESTATPPACIEHPWIRTFEVPELVKVRVQTSLPPTEVQEVTLAETCAELVNDPKRPKTNPAMAMAAISVIAMRMTVASTGEMAFLFFL